MQTFLGIDVGTSGIKTVLIDHAGRVLLTDIEEHSFTTPEPLHAESDPEDWWTGTVTSLKRVCEFARLHSHEIAAVGLTGQMHGLVILDKHRAVLRPCIMWNDQRTASQCMQITKTIGSDELLKITGNQVLPGFTAPKILWVAEHEPDIYAKINHVLLPKDYIRLKLTGELVTDVSDASGTSLLDVADRAWSSTITTKLGIDRSWLPQLMESQEVSGYVSAEAADRTGLPQGIPVVSGAGDQAAGGIGAGITASGRASIVLGTSGVVFAQSSAYETHETGLIHSFCHALPETWHVMGVTLSAAGSFKWYKDLFSRSGQAGAAQSDPYDQLIREAVTTPPGAEGLFFLPYLSGERTPHPDPLARGSFFGLTLRHERGHMTRALLEGVSFSLRDALSLIHKMGIEPTEFRISGGGARSPFWRQLIADVIQAEVITTTSTEGAPYGAAMLAVVAAGEYNSAAEAADAMIMVQDRHTPDSKLSEYYDEAFSLYQSLYNEFKQSYTRISKLEGNDET
ncbi:MAG: xylulokinase [Candidatus Marinimicrobia bacterium]|nr:xylulokinase [Candidatus Neomarinimicrobiota bacterium]MCF7850941.1 xylulokinase [Candidatus Neomarinimicrobiota bacterium]